MLLFEPSIDDRVDGIHLAAHPRMDNHFLGCLVYGQQLTQLHERCLPGLWIRRIQHLVEHVLDEAVLCFEEPDDFIGRLNNHFGHCVPPKSGN